MSPALRLFSACGATSKQIPTTVGYKGNALRRIEASIDLVCDHLDEFEVGLQRGFDVDVLLPALSFPQIENTVKCRWVGARERSDAVDGVTFARGHRLPNGNESVAKERAKSGARRDHDG